VPRLAGGPASSFVQLQKVVAQRDERPLTLRLVQSAQQQLPNPRFLIWPITGSTIAFLRRYCASPSGLLSFLFISALARESASFSIELLSIPCGIRPGAMYASMPRLSGAVPQAVEKG